MNLIEIENIIDKEDISELLSKHWISCTHKKPDWMSGVLVYYVLNGFRFFVVASIYEKDGDFVYIRPANYNESSLHHKKNVFWMTLPKPPKIAQGEFYD